MFIIIEFSQEYYRIHLTVVLPDWASIILFGKMNLVFAAPENKDLYCFYPETIDEK
jgi:hypothetical protein